MYDHGFFALYIHQFKLICCVVSYENVHLEFTGFEIEYFIVLEIKICTVWLSDCESVTVELCTMELSRALNYI